MDAQEMLESTMNSKVSDALIERRDIVALELGQNISEADTDYDTFFKKAMKKFGISSPGDLKSEEDKKEFFNYVDKNFKGKKEEEMYEEEEESEEIDETLVPGTSAYRDAMKKAKRKLGRIGKRLPRNESEEEHDEEVAEDIERRRQHLGMFDASGNPRMSRQERAALKREKLAIKNQDKRKHGNVPKASTMKKEEHEEVEEDIERRRQHLGMFDASGNPRMSRQERAALKREKLAIKNQDKRKHGNVPKASTMNKP
jgi:hypothetical protein